MKKTKPSKPRKSSTPKRVLKPMAQTTINSVSPMQALQFLEDMRVLYSTKDEPTKAISLRLPGNVLRLLKTRAAIEGKKYQSLLIEILREHLKAR